MKDGRGVLHMSSPLTPSHQIPETANDMSIAAQWQEQLLLAQC